jgi:hypothetical protein
MVFVACWSLWRWATRSSRRARHTFWAEGEVALARELALFFDVS